MRSEGENTVGKTEAQFIKRHWFKTFMAVFVVVISM